MRALGLLAGIGTLLREAEEHGCRVVGNVDSRSYFRRSPWVWEINFDAPYFPSFEAIKEERPSGWFNADLALGHPPCGNFSNLGKSAARAERFKGLDREEWHRMREKQRGLLPLFIDLVNFFKPRVFAFDNLPKMLKAISESEWDELLPRYRLTFLTIWNWDYGSPQRRKRLWVIGVRGRQPFKFFPPDERLDGPTDAWEAISDLPWEPWVDIPEIAHVHHLPGSKPIGGYWSRDASGERVALQDFVRYAYGFLRLPPGRIWPYMNNHGRHTSKPGRARLVLGKPSRTPSGTETLNHPLTGWPLTIRERARIMGWRDDFKLTDDDHPLDRTTITKLVNLTGRAVPSEFPNYLIPQLLDHSAKL